MEASDGLNPVSSQGYAEVQSVEARAMAGRHPFICIILAGCFNHFLLCSCWPDQRPFGAGRAPCTLN